MKRLFLLAISCAITFQLSAQQKNSEKEYAHKPLWIGMMDDTTANFFEVEKAYNTYWAHHEKPEGEDDVIGEHKEREKIPSKRKQKKIWSENDLRMAVKKYERWHESTLPWVRDDGRILTPNERLAIWKAQQNTSK
ncbi:hypothetical protein [Taibaiella soli]|uniref:hypothetical protein n=1 Tax=Taibaiella soli TaxID=1649169 RepID=UPI001403706A|nr:hypothetical protein [Taibaiella soli]